MKKNLKIFLSLLVFGLLSVSVSLAQSYPAATTSSDEGISLAQDSPLVGKYEIDFSAFNWTEENAEQAATYYENQSDYFTIKVDFANSRLVLKLDLAAPQTSTWNLQQWNNYLKGVL